MKLALIAALTLTGCSTTRTREPLTGELFETAKQACGATDAYILQTNGERAVGFRGVASDWSARQKQALCLKNKLKGTDARFIGFLSEWPKS